MNAIILSLFLTLGLALPVAATPLAECAPRAGLPNFFAKLDRNGTVRIGYLGGSITAQEGWRPKTLKWFQQQYPRAAISEINAAIGGTGSDLGVFRLRDDVLKFKPDLLFIEFAVNDSGAAPSQIHRCLEGIVRQTWRDNPATDICLVYTLEGHMLETLKQDQLPRSYAAMEQVAGHYGIPSINMGLAVARLEAAGKLVFQGKPPVTEEEKTALGDRILFSDDGVHPFPDTGHQVYLESIVRGMALVRSTGKPAPHQLGDAFVSDNWEEAKLVPLSRAMLSAGWTKLDPATNHLAKTFGPRLPEIWKANQPGEIIQFQFRGTAASLYDLVGPDCGQVIVTLDDQPSFIRPRFDAFCTYHRLASLTIGANLTNTVHTVKLEIHPDQPDKGKILSQRNEKMDLPERYNDRAWYAGDLMLVGDLVNKQK